MSTGIIKNVVIVQEGVDKYGDNIDQIFLQSIVDQGNAQKQGVKSRFGHPNMCDTTLGTFIGRYKNFSISSNSDGRAVVVADLHMDEVAKGSPKGDLYTYVLEMAQKNSDMFGNSIVFMPSDPAIMPNADGKDTEYIRLDSFLASDVVDSPAATDNLFKDTEDFGLLATAFLDEHPQIFELISKKENQPIVDRFIKKYTEMSKEKKSFMQKVRELIAGEDTAKEIQITDANGNAKTIDNPSGSGTPEVGDKITNADGSPAPGETVTSDGTVITADDQGVITGVQEAPGEDIAAEGTGAAPVAPAPDPAKEAEIATLKESIQTLTETIEAMKSEREAERADVLKEITTLKSQIKSTHQVKTGDTKFNSPAKEDKKETLTKEQLKERRESYGKK